MIVVIFELTLQPGRQPDYLDAAERLRPLLTDIDGFLSIERFESLAHAKPITRAAVASRRSCDPAINAPNHAATSAALVPPSIASAAQASASAPAGM